MSETKDECVGKRLQETVPVQVANKCHLCLIKIKVHHMTISDHLI